MRALLCFFSMMVVFLVLVVPAFAQPRPAAGDDNSDSVAVVIGNKNYRDAPPVAYAQNDAAAIRDWLVNGLQFRQENVFFKNDAETGDFNEIFGKDANTSGDLMDKVKSTSNVFVFYSGHGMPDMTAPDAFNHYPAYLLPVEVSWKRASNGYSEDLLLQKLKDVRKKIDPDRWLIVMLDACFSGSSNGVSLYHTSGPSAAPIIPESAEGVTRIFATSNGQYAVWNDEMRLGLLTSQFMFALSLETSKDPSNGRIPWSGIKSYVALNVPAKARANNRVEQAPEIDDSAKISFAPYDSEFVRPYRYLDEDKAAWEDAQRVATPQAFRKYIESCGSRRACQFKAAAESAWDDVIFKDNMGEYLPYLIQCEKAHLPCGHKGEASAKDRDDVLALLHPDTYKLDCVAQKTGCGHLRATPPSVAPVSAPSPTPLSTFAPTAAVQLKPLPLYKSMETAPAGDEGARNKSEDLAALPPTGDACEAASTEAITTPIRDLFTALTRFDLALYADQWAEDAIYQNSRTGEVRNKAQILAAKQRGFARWSRVQVASSGPALVSREGREAIVEDVYTLRIVSGDRALPPDSGRERYTLRCESDGRWRITRNDDYLP